MHSFINVTKKLGLIGAAVSLVSAGFAASPTQHTRRSDGALKSAVKRGLKANHQAFIQNVGQWNSKAQYRAQTGGLDYWLTKTGVTLDYHKPVYHNGKLAKSGQIVKMSFAGSSGAKSFSGTDPKAHTASYFTHGMGKMATPLAYRDVTSHGVYPGIDFRSYYEKENLRYDFIVKPNANPSLVQLKFDGATKLTVEGDDVKIGTQLGTFAHGKLVAYQVVNGRKVTVPAKFVSNHGTVGFKIGQYDRTKALTIDPVVYGTYYGGDDGWDAVTSMATDTNGNVFMTGWTQSAEFPLTTGPYFNSIKGAQNAFIARIQGDAYDIDYSAYFGGSNSDFGQYITVDQFNNVWIAGITTSEDFCDFTNSHGVLVHGNTKLNTSSNQPNAFLMRWATDINLGLNPHPNDVQTIQMLGDDSGAGDILFVNGFTIVPDPNPQPGDPVILVLDGKSDHQTPEVLGGTFSNGRGYLLRYSFNGTTFTDVAGASQYIGELNALAVDIGGVAVDDQGNMYVCGDVGDGANNYQTSSSTTTTFVTTTGPGTEGQLLQKQDLFARKYGPTGNMIYSCVIGGSSNEFIGGTDVDQAGNLYVSGNCIAVDSLGEAYITGNCNSFDYPRTRGAYGEVFDAWQNVVVTKISADATTLIYSTNLKVTGFGEPVAGGGCDSSVVPSGIAVDQSGQAYITGNIDVAELIFATPFGSPQDPSNYFPGSIQTGADGSDLPLSTTYTYPKPGDLPTGTDWLNVLDPTGTSLVYGTYLGGGIDNKVYGPYVDPFGDVWVFGWTDSERSFADPVSGTPVNDSGALPAGLITAKAFKAHGDAGQYPPFTGMLNGTLWGIIGNVPAGPPTISIFQAMDGWLAKLSIGQPIVSQVNLTPPTIPGGNGASSSCAVVLSSAAPVQGATITLDLLTPQFQATGAASFSPTTGGASPVTETTITIPGGATTTAPITVYSAEVTVPTQVLVRAYYQGNFLIAPLNVVPWLQNFSVNPSGTVGGNTVTGTIVLATVAPAAGITVSIQTSSALLQPPATVNIAAGQQSANFTVTTSGVDQKSFPILTASLFNFGIAQAVELDPAAIINVILNPIRVSGYSTISGVVTLNGLPGPNFNLTNPNVGIYYVPPASPPVGFSITSSGITAEESVPLSFAAGSSTATFTVNTPYVPSTVTEAVQVQMTAVSPDPGNLYGYKTQTSLSNFTVDPSALFTFTVDKGTANPGDIVNGTVSLNTAADSSGTIVNVSSNSNAVSFSATSEVTSTQVVVPAGSTGATFPIYVGSTVVTVPTLATITVTRGTVTIQRNILVEPSTISLSFSSNSILGGNPVQATVTISDPAPAGGLPLNFSFNPIGFASVAPNQSTTIPAGQTSVTFNLNTVSTTITTQVAVTVTAALGGVSGAQISDTETLTVRAPSLISLAFTPSSVKSIHFGSTVGRVTLDGPAPAGGLVITLDSSNPLVANVPTTITVKAGSTSAAFTVITKRVSRALTTTVTATDGAGDQVSATLTATRF